MTTAALPSKPEHPGRRGPSHPRHLTRLTGAAAVLTAAALLVPFPLAAASSAGGYPGPDALREGVTTGFVRFWAAGTGALGPELTAAVDFWARFHVVKAALAGALLGVLLVLVPRLWRASTEAAGRRRWGLRSLMPVTASLLVLALLALVANVQGALAPLSSVLGVLPLGAPTAELAAPVSQAREAIVTGSASPAAATLLDDFARYHAVMAGLGALVTVVLLVGTAAVLRRRFRTPRADRAHRRALVTTGACLLVLAAFFAVVTLANAGTARHPAAALVGFLDGGS